MLELTPSQFKRMLYIAAYGTDIVQTMVTADAAKDTPEQMGTYLDNARDMDALATIGFLSDVTERCSAALKSVREKTGREFRVFELTELGYYFFIAQASPNN